MKKDNNTLPFSSIPPSIKIPTRISLMTFQNSKQILADLIHKTKEIQYYFRGSLVNLMRQLITNWHAEYRNRYN
jgi:hypothetical protein